MYGLDESQFKLFFTRAARLKGIAGENLLSLLERRLDNVIFRLGFVSSRQQARQAVLHSHFLLNGKKVNIPSALVRKGDEIVIKEKSRAIAGFVESMQAIGRKEIPRWLTVDPTTFKGVVTDLPVRSDITADVEERLIVELYSK